ncbi:hypothetical protein [Nocardioides aquiterrae]|uniref:Uncharacterized protein n=1 Tax=Nocardioides aquiterrae TaxID=203799 RepID=A0ABP4F332_9ACTN
MKRSILGSWMSGLYRQPVHADVLEPARGWEPLPDDVLEWMGARPYPLEESA